MNSDMEQVFIDICDELGCAYNNEAALEAVVDLKTGSIVTFEADTIVNGIRYEAGTYRMRRIGPPPAEPQF